MDQSLRSLINLATRATITTQRRQRLEEEQRLYDEECDIEYQLLALELGDGPMRFACKGERSLQKQIGQMKVPDQERYHSLKRKWQSLTKRQFDFPDDWYLRFIRVYKSHRTKRRRRRRGNAEEATAWKVMKKFPSRYLSLDATTMRDQLSTKTIFPVPGLRTKSGLHDVFYMRPSRYFPETTPTQTIIDNLVYVVQSMMEKERCSEHGIAFLANMDDWKMKNFDIEYCYQFMMTLQGHVTPVRVELFLIVNPPSWFGTVWKIMKTMLTPSFRRKVRTVRQDKLYKYLEVGFETFLPDEIRGLGQADTHQLVQDYVSYREYADEQRPAITKFNVSSMKRRKRGKASNKKNTKCTKKKETKNVLRDGDGSNREDSSSISLTTNEIKTVEEDENDHKLSLLLSSSSAPSSSPLWTTQEQHTKNQKKSSRQISSSSSNNSCNGNDGHKSIDSFHYSSSSLSETSFVDIFCPLYDEEGKGRSKDDDMYVIANRSLVTANTTDTTVTGGTIQNDSVDDDFRFVY